MTQALVAARKVHVQVADALLEHLRLLTRDGDRHFLDRVERLRETADLVTRAGGRGIPIALDHADDEAVARLFARVKAEHGRLDILVNNAAQVADSTTMSGGFWQKPLEAVNLITVGLRSHFVAAYRAAPLLIANGHGLIVHHRVHDCPSLLAPTSTLLLTSGIGKRNAPAHG